MTTMTTTNVKCLLGFILMAFLLQGDAQVAHQTPAGHPFCLATPFPNEPKMAIFTMDVDTGFTRGYRSNQSVRVEITAKYPHVWKINQLFIHVPETDVRLRMMLGPDANRKTVGTWAWNLAGGTKPVDCGSTAAPAMGQMSFLSGMGADAAVLIAEEGGYTNVSATWVPPTDYTNIFHRKTIQIEAYITFEKTPPGYGGTAPGTAMGFNHGAPIAQSSARWIRRSVSLVSLDYIDMHNYMLSNFGPMYSMLNNPSQWSEP